MKRNLQVNYLRINELTPYANNSRTHSDEQINQIVASVEEFGFTNPILIDEDRGIIAGHGRVLAARKLGLEEVPTITLSNLTEAQKKAYVIADNKLALNAGWDEELLKFEMESLGDLGFDLDLLGFDGDEMAKLFDETADIRIDDDIEIEDALEVIKVKFDPEDKIHIINEITEVVERYANASVWVDE